MWRKLESTVEIQGRDVDVGGSLPMSLNPDGSPCRVFQHQIHNGKFRGNTLRVLKRARRDIAEGVLGATNLCADTASVVASYIGLNVPKVEELWEFIEDIDWVRIAKERMELQGIITFMEDGTCAFQMFLPKYGHLHPHWGRLPVVHRHMSQELLDFYVDCLAYRAVYTYNMRHIRIQTIDPPE